MSVIGEAAMSAFFGALFEKIASSDLLKFISEKEVLSEINKWKNMLVRIRDVLDDAEEKQMTKKSVKDWLSDLKDLAYDVEDVLDEFATESLQRKLKKRPEASTSKFRKLIPSRTGFSPRALKFNSEMDSKIKKITARLQEITAQRNDLDLREIVGGISIKAPQRRPPSTCLPDEPKVYGRDEDRRKILDFLLRDDSTNAKVGVLPIVGMGGLGKTTLAQLVYNDGSLRQHFHVKAWVCVSDDFEIVRITKAILESITSMPCDLKDLNQVQVQLHKELAGKKFLIVLDDVWSERYDDWIALRPPFMDGAPGCRIIVTTRSEVVARNIGTIKFHTLQHISDDDCWMLFTSHAFESRSVGTLGNPDIIREKVINKCDGLPLAARTLAGLLRSKQVDKWDDILSNKIWSFDKSNILPVLMLSYYHLPSQLKRCFSYCAVFPKGYEFTEMEVVLLWMAEGLIQQMDDNKQMEDVGSEYFQDLLSRSLFQPASSGGSKFVMHDLVNDLVKNVAGETSLRLEDEAFTGKQFRGERIRHSSYIVGHYDGIKRFQPFYKVPQLRSFLPLSLGKAYVLFNHLTSDVPSKLLPKLRYLRVLSFKGYRMDELPDSISDLKHLRYFDLSFTNITSLPESTTLLCNLQTLILRGCGKLKKLPSRMEDLVNLRHLNIEGVWLENGLPLGVKELKDIKLSTFPVGRFGGAGLAALKNIKVAEGRLHLLGLGNVTNVLDGRESNLKEKKDLRILSLQGNYFTSEVDGIFDMDLLDGLQPHIELEELYVKDYGGESFPFWVGDPSFRSLTLLRIWDCNGCTSLPSLGSLSSLKHLVINKMFNLKRIGYEFYGEGCSNPFPALETLCFINMRELEEWNSCGFEFSCLLELTIENCPKLLGKIPSHLPKLKKLKITDCGELILSLPPVVSELIISRCKEVDFRNMVEFDFVVLCTISKFTFHKEGLMGLIKKSKSLTIDGNVFSSPPSLSSYMAEEKERMVQLEKLALFNCENFVHLDHIFMSLRELTVIHCPRLVSFQDVSFPSTLRAIQIWRCNALASLPDAFCLEELIIKECNSLISIGREQLSSTLKRLVIKRCKNLRSLQLLDEVQGSTYYSSSSIVDDSNLINLEFLSVSDCPSLTSLTSSRGQLPPSLKHLKIKKCARLESIGESFNNSITLEHLLVKECPSLEFLSSSKGQLPTSLKRLQIERCSMLESIAESFNTATSLKFILIRACPNLKYLPKDLHKLINLQNLHINACHSLVSFPEGGLPTSSLKNLLIIFCNNLEALPDNIHHINSLQQLVIQRNAPGIVTFPREGFSTNLTELKIANLLICKPLFEWGLHRLATLTTLSIWGGCPDMVSFPCDDIGMVLPPSLNSLTIEDFQDLEYLSRGFQNLTSLESLRLCDCPKLASFPENGLPPSLLKLYISGCPILKQRCQKDNGKEWQKIAHIPYVV